MSLIFLDLELTGRSPEMNGIIEIGAYWPDTGETFNRRCNPGSVGWSKMAMSYHRISPEDVQDAPPYTMMVKKLNERVNVMDRLAGWNINKDVVFLRKAYAKVGLMWPFDYHVLDVWCIVQFLRDLGQLPTSVKGLHDTFEYVMEQSCVEKHKALVDAITAHALYDKLVKDYCVMSLSG